MNKVKTNPSRILKSMKYLIVSLCLSFAATAAVHAQDPILKDAFADVASDTPLTGHEPEVGAGTWKAGNTVKISRDGDVAYVTNGDESSATAEVAMTADAAEAGFTIRTKVRSASRPPDDNGSWTILMVKNDASGSLFEPGTEYLGIMFLTSKSGLYGYSVISTPKDRNDLSLTIQLKLHGAGAAQSWKEDDFNDVVFSYDPANHSVSLSVNGTEIWTNEALQFPEQLPTAGLNRFQIAWNGARDEADRTAGRIGPVTVTPLR
ncbi:MAG: hypothetical protein WCL49_11585 [bacterium]